VRASGLAWTAPGRPEPLFDGLDLVLDDGDRLGVIGANGCGKTTLLRLLAGRLAPDAGAVHAATRAWLVPQTPPVGPAGSTLRDVLLDLDPDLGPVRSRLRAAERAGVPDADGYADDLARYDEARGWDAEHRAEVEAERLGVGAAALDRPADAASGGERRMLALAAVLAREPRLVVLDEPSDALDARSRTALAERLRAFDGALVVASHDRALLDAVTNRTLAFEHDGVRQVRGGYGRYAAARAEERAERERRAGRARREIAHLEQVARGYRTWSGRKEKEKSGALDKGFVGARAARLMKRATVATARREAEIEELRRAKPWVEPEYALPMPTPKGLSGPVFVCLGATAAPLGAREGAAAFAPLDLRVAAGERVAVAGPNGSGKSTLLAMLAGRLPATAGRLARTTRASLGYLPQAGSALDGGTDRPIAAAGATAASGGDGDATARACFAPTEVAEARRRLGSLGFGAEAWSTPRSRLSGGQRQKLRLVRLLAAAPDVLVLDEPTLHLDLPAIERLQQALAAWSGTIVLVSHDAAFADAVAQRVVRLGGDAGSGVGAPTVDRAARGVSCAHEREP
jgi:ATPase subunit of ABC transporter with duplicated ATPase domains